MAPDSQETQACWKAGHGIRHVKHGAQLSQIMNREGSLQTDKGSFSSIKVSC